MSLLERPTREANISPGKRYNIGDETVISESNSTSSTDTETTESQNNIQNEIEGLPTVSVRMLNLFREFAVFCLVMVTLSALTKDPPKVTKPPAAYPFFPVGSTVKDWYRGQISRAIETTRSNDVAFIMYYAPWDADSQVARNEFEIAASYMQEYVSFAAVNCWQPQGECRMQYTKVYKWPVLIAYPSHGRGIQYNGPISAPHIISFLKRVCNPILRATKGELEVFDDVFVVAEVNASPGSLDFSVIYSTALSYLERDPQHRITFYVRPSPVNEPSLSLHLWNETLAFPTHEKRWMPDEILHWILKNIKQVTTWVMPSGMKSMALAAHLQNGAVLVLFTLKNPLHASVDYYDMLQEIALDYNNCGENVVVKMNALSVQIKRAENRAQYQKLKAMCRVKQRIMNRKIITNISSVWANSSTCSRAPGRVECDMLLQEKINSICSESKECVQPESEPINNIEGKKCSISENYISILTGQNDARSSENLLARFNKERCKQFLAAEKFAKAMFEMESDSMSMNITGLHCKSNNTLSLVAMDSTLHYHFAERFGIDLSKRPDRSAAVIVNDKMETHYIMADPINSWTVKQFIYNFTKNDLNRSLDSLVTINLTNTQHHILKEEVVDNTNIVIKELNTETFLPTVSQTNMAVIVFYYSKQCAFCSGIAFNFLMAAKKLATVNNLLFARIDGETNNLPWEYTMETYPTILMFPANTKSESRVLPSNVPITVPNLIGFILANIDPSLKLNVMWSICNQTKVAEEKTSCNSSLLGETLTVIDKTLKEWRKSNKRQKQALLHSLRHLRQLHLLFAHSSHKHKLIQNYFKQLHVKLGQSGDYRNLTNHSRTAYYKDEL